MNNEPFDEHLSWELRSLVEDTDPPPTLRPATVVRTRSLPRPWILVGSVAAAVIAIAALLVAPNGNGGHRQRVASEGRTSTTTEGGVVVAVPGPDLGTTVPGLGSATTLPRHSTTTRRASPPTTAKSAPTTTPRSAWRSNRYVISDENGSGGWGLTFGPDGNVWVAMFDYAVVRLTPDGAAQRFPVAVSDQSSYLPAITAGPDGNLWATKRSADAIVRVTPSGGVTEFGAEAQGFITPGPDGALWFDSTHGIGRITTSGVTTYFPTNSFTYGVAFGSDRNIWFAEADGKIGRMTPSGSVTYFPVQHSPRGVTRGSDGNIWFYGSAGVGRVTPNGNVQEISVGGADGQAVGITTGPDGNVWFMQGGGPGIGRVKPDMTVDFFGVGPTDLYASAMKGIISGPDGFLWFTTNGEVDRFAPPKS